jgi:hypothetical protein
MVEAIDESATIPISSLALFQNVLACSGSVSVKGDSVQLMTVDGRWREVDKGFKRGGNGTACWDFKDSLTLEFDYRRSLTGLDDVFRFWKVVVDSGVIQSEYHVFGGCFSQAAVSLNHRHVIGSVC